MGRGFAVIALTAVVAAFGVLAMDRIAEASTAQSGMLVLLVFAILALGIAFRPDRRMPLLCDPTVLSCAFLSQFFVLAPVFISIWGLSGSMYFHRPEPESIVMGLVAFLVMMALWLVAVRSRIGVMLADYIPDFRSSRRKPPSRWIEVFLLAACVVAIFWWLGLQGGLLAKLSAGYGKRINPAFLSLAHRVLIVVTLLFAWRVIDRNKPARLDVALLAGVLAFDAVFFGVLLGARKYLLFLFFGILTLWLLRRGIRALPKLRTAVVLVALLVFFSVWGAIRAKPLTAVVGLSSDPSAMLYASTPGLHMGYVTAITGPFGGACKVMEVYPEHEPFRHGKSLAIWYLGFIPRAIWPNKPIGWGKEFTRYYDGPLYDPTGGFSVGATLSGSFWVDFGWAGIVVGGLLMGLLCRMITAYAVKGMKNGLQLQPARVLIPAVFVIGLGELRATATVMLNTWTWQLIPLLFVFTFFQVDSEEHTPAPAGEAPRSRVPPSPQGEGVRA